ncbi:2-dehydropantoate 2-reductase [Elizabethkingia miricola]|uniref:2-dehydropantoate 2-reductase n=2 Tax=Elizabethkingia TaxID=308865 RepID=A0AAP1BQ05_ELIMR|nr:MULTISPECIES: 2-dehydropantoate 2-reductase [Elizabethkingia]AQX10713.1 2-dehydropantoate 2-reductase [Elizabethkingia ursingii]KUY14454.1 2-dehydropantoate 2-reductase [Elizabethkingia miricola]MCL1654859.1 2-dehydropantoate 2-reductase [Elizabethkingia miricola]OPB72228.1 2-dehydropantoate 2-reductase [Elizabethkingia ursingii]OPC31331.1 2-dehydropantoate 2-reductase [Elizabethkingia miricola]
MSNKNIVVIGLGGVGGYFGFKMTQKNEATKEYNISFVARAATYEIVKEKGLTLLSPEHDNAITKPNVVLENIADIKNPNLIFICVKEYDLENICQQLVKVITPDTILFPMMNGADIYDRIRKIIPDHVILPSCVYVASHIKEKGIVEHKGKPGILIFGHDPQNKSADIDWVVRLLEESNIKFSFKDNPLTDIWEKFIFIASFGLVTAKHNSSISSVCTDEEQNQEAVEIMEEIKLIAKAKNIYLPEDIVAKTMGKAVGFPPGTPTSLQLDIHSDKESNELELFGGAVINYGKELNINTPSTLRIYEEIKAGITK